MNSLEKDIIQWDVKSWSKALHYWEKQVDWNHVNTALELGGREGGLSLWLAKKGINVTCSDLENVHEKASILHQAHQISDKINYQDIDATDIPYENHFDVIVFKSIIGGIGSDNDKEKQRIVFQQIHKALKPGGILLFAENLSASYLHKAMRKRFIKWGNSWRYVNLSELTEFLSIFESYELKSTGFLATFGRNEGQRNSLSTLDNCCFNHITPNNWRYIGYGFAKK
jgi:SAM-dependent methyltransferase